MYKLFETNGKQPLKIVFDINTHMSIGEVYKCFIQEVGSYMWRDIGFDKDTWIDVFEAERIWSDLGVITNYPMAPVYWASLNNRICASYRGRKNVAKTCLTAFEGGVEAARAQATAGMDLQRWNVAIGHFLTKKHKK
ncbi:unnamed protein product [Lactuca saligna]|uniref:Uncharacterized protein n=1 Tax=Lactuca saligna TaxID=75948 RepID=A0AA35UP27_LACSI|nr:unnamed protein product [Lactuca saligna]